MWRGSADDDVDNLVGDDDDLADCLAVEPLGGSLVGEGGRLDIFLRRAGGEFDAEAHFAVELNGVVDGVLFQIILVPCGPGGVAHGGVVAQGVPQLFGDVGGEGSEEHCQGLKYGTRMALLLRKLVDADHEGGHGGVVAERLDVGRHLLDELVEALERVGRGSVVGHKPLIALPEEAPEAAQEAVHTVDAVGVPRLALFERTEEHLV